jgi:hypothetical protein
MWPHLLHPLFLLSQQSISKTLLPQAGMQTSRTATTTPAAEDS